MTLKRIFICDICGIQTDQEHRLISGYLNINLMVGNLCYSQVKVIENSHTCKECLGIISSNLRQTFDEIVSKLGKE